VYNNSDVACIFMMEAMRCRGYNFTFVCIVVESLHSSNLSLMSIEFCLTMGGNSQSQLPKTTTNAGDEELGSEWRSVAQSGATYPSYDDDSTVRMPYSDDPIAPKRRSKVQYVIHASSESRQEVSLLFAYGGGTTNEHTFYLLRYSIFVLVHVRSTKLVFTVFKRIKIIPYFICLIYFTFFIIIQADVAILNPSCP